MRIGPLHFVLAVLVAALLTYGVVQVASPAQSLLIGAGSFVVLVATLTTLFGVMSDDPGAATNARVVGAMFFVMLLAVQLLFACLSLPNAAYVVTTGIGLAVFVLLVNAVTSARQ